MLLFAGVLGGYLAHSISWLPSITGFMAIGLAQTAEEKFRIFAHLHQSFVS